MRKFLFSGSFILPVLIALLVGCFTLFAFKESKLVCTKASQCCKKAQMGNGGEMLWDQVSRRFVTLISI